MRTYHYPPLAHQVQQQITEGLLQQLRPVDYSPRCTARTLIRSLLFAAVCQISLSVVAVLRRFSVSRETLRKAFRKTLPSYAQLQAELPNLLAAHLPRGLRRQARRRRYPMAIDLHHVPYYKRQSQLPAEVRKGQRQAGTSYHHPYATASLLCKGQYYVVAMTPYAVDENLAQATRRLLQ